jgi:mono/diheme cytochrome c family protein
MRRIVVMGIGLGLVLGGCSEGRKSASGFRLPDGDAERGRQVFVRMRCHSCHEVAGVDLPPPVAEPGVGVELGGPVAGVPSDGELVTGIIHPSHQLIAGHPPERVASGRLSRMGDFTEAMTVRDLIDVVAFLHPRYEVIPAPLPGP